jgi:5-methylcytosine-specific restriction endonuclease McrA
MAVSDAWRKLGGQRRTLARLVYQRDRATPGYICPVCRQPIDWTRPFRDPLTGAVDPLSKSVDHGEELQDGGSLTDLDNLWSAHFGCNSRKGAARRHQREARARRVSNAAAPIMIDPHTI